MIIPKIQYNPDSNVDQCVSQLKHWGLFGQVALVGVGADRIQQLEPVIKRVGGLVDLLVEFSQPNEQDALAVLNAGAARLLCEHGTPQLEAVPSDRVTFFLEDNTQDEAIPKDHVLSLTSPSSERISELEMARVDCLVSEELLTPELITSFFNSVLVSDRPDGLWSTIIVDPLGLALGLAYSNEESLFHAIENRVGTYWSRSRDDLWIKGETSGATQQLLGIRLDCDRDCLRFQVTQDSPGFCHRETHTCFGAERTIQSVIHRLAQRINETDEKSFTRKLASDPEMLEKKLLEEVKELSEASQADDKNEVAWEAADVLYFSLVAMLKNDVSLDQVHAELARRMNRVVRRGPGLKS